MHVTAGRRGDEQRGRPAAAQGERQERRRRRRAAQQEAQDEGGGPAAQEVAGADGAATRAQPHPGPAHAPPQEVLLRGALHRVDGGVDGWCGEASADSVPFSSCLSAACKPHPGLRFSPNTLYTRRKTTIHKQSLQTQVLALKRENTKLKDIVRKKMSDAAPELLRCVRSVHVSTHDDGRLPLEPLQPMNARLCAHAYTYTQLHTGRALRSSPPS